MSNIDIQKTFGNHLPKIKDVKTMLFDPIWSEEEHLSYGFELIFIKKGSIDLEFEDQSFLGNKGDLLLVPPKTIHRDNFDTNTGLSALHCSFDWPLADLFLHHVSNSKLISMSPSAKSEINRMTEIIRPEFLINGELSQLFMRSWLLSLLYFILGQCHQSKEEHNSSRKDKIIEKITAYLKKNYHLPLSLEHISDDLRISPSHLSHLFSSEKNYSLFNALTSIRIDKAKELLVENKYSIDQISSKVGYSSSNYFSKVFKKHCGCSPRDYKLNPIIF